MGENYVAGQASLWAQIFGPNTKPEYLGCHELGDVEEPLGDLNLIYCPDPADMNKFRVVGSYQSEPGPVTTSLTTRMSKIRDWLERAACAGTLFCHKGVCGRRDVFQNYERSFVFRNFRVTTRGLATMAVNDPANQEASAQSFDLSCEELLRIAALSAGKKVITADGNLLAIAVGNSPRCAGACGPYQAAGDYLVAVGANASTSAAGPAMIYISTDGGVTWTAAAADPFDGGEDISAVVWFPIDENTWRIIVARGVTDAGNPAVIAYSDDNGATWTAVNVGSTNAQFVEDSEGLFALDQYHIWCVTSGGYVYFSDDGGLTWAVQSAGTLTTENLRGVQFISTAEGWAVGEDNAILHTADGGTNWALITGPTGKASDDIEALAVISEQRVFVGFDDGELWYTEDQGATWTQRTFPGSGAGVVQWIGFYNDLVGFMIHNTVAPVGTVLRTIDGGYTWQALTTPSNAGLNAGAILDLNRVMVVGNVSGTTAVVVDVAEAA